MATAIIRPTGHIIYSNYVTYAERAYDNNTTTKLTAKSSGYPRVIFTNFDMSAIPQKIINGGAIRNISICIYGKKHSGTDTMTIRAVRDSKSDSTYTDCGDASLKMPWTTTVAEYEVAAPIATTYWNNNISAFMNGGFQVRLYYIDDADYIYEVYAKVEYELPTITVTTNASPPEGGIVTGGGTHESGSTVTATATPNTGYAFSHWLVNGANAGSSNPISGALTSDTTVTAVFEKIKYTVTWYNEDGTFLEEDTVEYGVMPTYDSATPTKPSTAQYTYTFKGWHIEVTTVTASIDYYARYTETINKYTVRWENDDGTLLEEDTTEYGVTPTYDGATPTKPSTVQYTYTFIGWDTTIEEVTKDIVYTAVYSQIINSYFVEGLSNEGGYVVGGGSFSYGSTTILTAKPYDGYKFVSWSDGYIFPGRTVEVLGDATYTAIFEKIGDSKVYKGTKPVSVYKGNKKVSVYIGTTKIYG